MTDLHPTPPAETWCLDDLQDCTPGDYLIGCLEHRWIGDDESKQQALVAMIAATYAYAGIPHETAADLAIERVEAGVTVIWDGHQLGFKPVGA